MATKAEVRDRAAGDLGILMLGQTLAAQHATRITSAYEEVYAQLKKDGLATWASTGEVPDELVPHMSALVADSCVLQYGVSPERHARIKAAALEARREIRKYTSPDYPSMEDAVDY